MTLRLQQAIDIAASLSMAEKLELLKKLSVLIQEAHALENQASTDDDNDEIGFSPESFRRSWEQAIIGKTLPASVLWEDDDIE